MIASGVLSGLRVLSLNAVTIASQFEHDCYCRDILIFSCRKDLMNSMLHLEHVIITRRRDKCIFNLQVGYPDLPFIKVVSKGEGYTE